LRRGQKTEGRGQKIEDVRLKMDLGRAGMPDESGASVCWDFAVGSFGSLGGLW